MKLTTIAALAATLFAIFSMRPWARRVGLVDRPSGRKQHVGRVPVIGGICFFVGTLVGLGYLGYVDRFVMSLMMGSVIAWSEPHAFGPRTRPTPIRNGSCVPSGSPSWPTAGRSPKSTISLRRTTPPR